MSAVPSPHEREAIARDVLLDFLGRAPAAGDQQFEALCARRPELAVELRALWRERGAQAADVERPPSAPIARRLRELGEPVVRGARYRQEELVARGGMGEIHRVWDRELDRTLAMKVLSLGDAPQHRAESIARFLEEARVTAQLDHPGIVPVHELGVDARGRLFFTMKLVAGRDLRRVFELAWNESEGWSTTRVATALLKVCEALVYAHSKGVIHRDLKPANVMVGRYGEVYVMDWGVARVIRGLVRSDTTTLADLDANASDDPLLTAVGEVLGTPAYMSPEQARGDGERLSPRSDVYSVGAMLYHLLARRPPFSESGSTSTTREVLERLIAGPPRPVRECEPRAAPALVAICEKAMARDLERRYASMAELADDLRAYLEGRVVRAHRSGTFARVEKWIARNRSLAATIALALVLAAGGAFALESSRASRANLALLEQLRRPQELMLQFDELWPATPEKLPAMQRWLAAAQRVAAERGNYHARLDELRTHALPFDPDTPLDRKAREPTRLSKLRADQVIAYYEQQIERLRSGATICEGWSLEEMQNGLAGMRASRQEMETRQHDRATWRFTNPTDELVHDRLAEIVPLVDALVSPAKGASTIERVQRTADLVADMQRRSLDDARDAWRDALASIRDEHECPQYGGLVLAPQFGLVPIGRDPRSGLWEFAHLASGDVPRRDARGELVLSDGACVVLVLLPGGCTTMGSQMDSAQRPNYDAHGQVDETPMFPLRIAPFLFSKYELTQAQWQRWMGANPSNIVSGNAKYPRVTPRNPVEYVGWLDALQALRELGLTLPSEAQWEYAARAGGDQPWSTGATAQSLAGSANLLDATALETQFVRARDYDPQGAPRDGWDTHAPVGSLAPNAFGLHDVHGNVAEWCRDSGETEYEPPYYLGTGERQAADEGSHTVRGGDFMHGALWARSASRRQLGEHYQRGWVGLRPSRDIDR